MIFDKEITCYSISTKAVDQKFFDLEKFFLFNIRDPTVTPALSTNTNDRMERKPFFNAEATQSQHR